MSCHVPRTLLTARHRWDSSDPERAPPPLPLNPQSPGVSRAGTSPAIQSAHAALTEKARESNLVPHLAKRVADSSSPERPTLRPPAHRRMQSAHSPSVKDMSMMIEAGSRDASAQSTPRSPEKIERPTTPLRSRDAFAEAREDGSGREDKFGTPRPGPSLTPIIRPTVRRPHQSILGENAPPQSATMLALQNMTTNNINSSSAPPKDPEPALANVTNGPKSLVKGSQSLESLSHQIHILTDIATTLQKEMALLSRRSRDNATDLLSLKEATNARDEDIRRSLRELISDAKARSAAAAARDPPGAPGPFMAEGKHNPSSPTQQSKSARPFSLPRIPSPNSFAASLDRESLLSTPSLCSDSPATVALLEKIIREMGTKDGQDTLLSRLTELAEKLSGMATAEKVDELARWVKSNHQQAIVPVAAGGRGGGGGGGIRDRNWGFDDDDHHHHHDHHDGDDDDHSHDSRSHRGALDFHSRHHHPSAPTAPKLLTDRESRSCASSTRASDVVDEDVLKAIHTLKDSVSQGGGLTAEVKALVRELRGEVLGMGREIGRRLDEVTANGTEKSEADTKAEMAKVIEDALSEMNQQINDIVREHRQQSASGLASRDASVDYKEIYNSVRAALKDTQANKNRAPELRREDVIQAVKDAWEKYKPEIEIQQIGLERDEILACLQEGLRAYAPRDDRPPGATRDEVFQAVVEGLKHFAPPKVEIPATLSRDEIVDAVRECLEEFEFPVAPSAVDAELTKNDMLDAVKEALRSSDFPKPPPPPPPSSDLTKDDVRGAVTEGLQSFDFSAVHANAPLPQSVSKADVSDAVKQGLGSLDLSSDISDAVKEGLHAFDLPASVLKAVQQALESFDFSAAYASAVVPRPDLSRVDVAAAVKEGIECLDLTNNVTLAVKQALQGSGFSSPYSTALVPRNRRDSPHEDVADAMREGLQSIDLAKSVTEAVRQALEGFDFSAVSSALVARPVLSRVDVVDAVKEGLESLNLSAALGDAVKKELESFDFASAQSSALVVPQTSSNGEIVQRLHEIRDLLLAEVKAVSEEAKQSMSASGRDAEQVLDATKDGFEKLRQDIESYVDRARGDSDPVQFMERLLSSFDGFRDEVTGLVTRSSDESRAMLKEEIESLRDAVNSSLVPALPQPGNHKELIEALQEGLHGLRKEISTRPIAGLSEILDALQDGLGDIRASVNNLRDKPADLTANDEILDALKEGLDSVRSDIDSLREEAKNSRALAAVSDDANAVARAEQMLKPEDIKNLEVLITQLSSKVEAMESRTASLSREDLAEMEETLRSVADSVAGMPNREPVVTVEESLRKIQETVAELSTRQPLGSSSTDPALREDIQAIETILRNTKARLDEFMDGEQAVRKDHIDTLEALVLEARESIGGLSARVDSTSRKEQLDGLETLILETRESLGGLAAQIETLSRREDVTMVESLVTQVIASFGEMKERHEKALEDPEKVTKTDVEAVGAVCLDTKSLIEQTLKTDLASVPSKEDIETLEARLGDLRDRLDAQAEANAKAFEERRTETAGVGASVAEVKTLLEESQAVLRSKLEDGARGVDSINLILDTLSESVRKNDNVSVDVKKLLDIMKLEFEESRTSLVDVKLELDEKVQTSADTLLAKLDERMAELTTKYEELQLVQDDRATKSEARDAELEAAVSGTKAIAEELKCLVDALGAAVTDSMEKMEEASKTVFERVEDLVAKSDENHADGKAEHQLTRERVHDAIGKVEGLHGKLSEYQPKILRTLEQGMLYVGQQYEQLKASTIAIQKRVEQPLLPPPPEKYDDTVVREKLETLIGHARVADKALEQLSTLDEVHARVKQTAAELSAFIAAQTQRIAQEHEDREKTLQETTIALERRLEEKEQVEAHIALLREEEARLKESITVTLPEEQGKITEQFLINLQAEEARLKEAIDSLREEQARMKETFLANLKEEQARLLETNVAIKEEQDQLKETFLANLKEEQARLMETNVALKEEQDKLKEMFLANLKEEQERLMETNVALKEEHEKLQETFLANLRDEEARLKEMNDALRDEQQVIRDTFLANLREEESLLKEVNAGLREEQERLRESFLANFKEEEERLRAANEALRQEQEQIKTALKEEQEQAKATFKEEHERFKIELLTNLMEEEARLKEANAALREEHEQLRKELFASLRDEEERLKQSLRDMRAEQESLSRQKTRLTAELSSLDTALRLRREELHDMEARAESLERRILEGVMDHSRVLLMAKASRVSGRDPMSRKRVASSQKAAENASEASKPRTALNMAMSARSKASAPNATGTSRRIFSLSQINNNVPAGGIKRSQSVRTAGTTGSRGHRKTSWATGAGSKLPNGKSYGDLGRSMTDDKENMELRERDEEHDEHGFEDTKQPSVDTFTSESHDDDDDDDDDDDGLTVRDTHGFVDELAGDVDRRRHHEEGDDEEDRFFSDRDERSSLRRSSHGTTVITAAEEQDDEEEEGEEAYECVGGDEDEDTVSDWTESVVVGRESDVDVGAGRVEREASVPVAVGN